MNNNQIRAIKDKYSADHIARYGLTGIGVGYKRVKGIPTSDLAVVYMVKKKLPKDKIAADQLLPAVLDEVPTDVVETGEIKACYLTAKVRPAVPGYSCGHPLVTAGTLGCVVYDSSGNRYILSNNHVLANENNASVGDATYQPGVYDGGTSADTVANLTSWVDIYNRTFTVSSANATYGATYTNNGVTFLVCKTISGGTTLYTDNQGSPQASGTLTLASGTGDATITFSSSSVYTVNVDCALAEITDNSLVTDTGYWGAPIENYTIPELNDPVYKTGRTTSTTWDVVIYEHSDITVSYGALGTQIISDCFITGTTYEAIQGGDSGSCARLNDSTAVGLVFATGQSGGSDTNLLVGLGIYIYMSNIVAALPIIDLPFVAHSVSWVLQSQGPNSPSTVVNTPYFYIYNGTYLSIDRSSSPYSWNNPTNAEVNDGNFATVGPMTTAVDSQFLFASNFGFSIPADAIIMEILAEVNFDATGTSGDTMAIYLEDCTAINAPPTGRTETSGTVGAFPSLTYYPFNLLTFNSQYAKDFVYPWVQSIINTSAYGFRVDIEGLPAGSPNVTVNIDHVRLTIFYVIPSHTSTILPNRTSTIEPNRTTIIKT